MVDVTVNLAPPTQGVDDRDLLLDHAAALPRPVHLHQAAQRIGGRQVSSRSSLIFHPVLA